MIAKILSTGDEVLFGDIVDTNAGFLSRTLKESGIKIEGIRVVGDDLDTLVSELNVISASSDLCIVTGGLGPTADDLTALACSRAAGVELSLDSHALASMKHYFRKKGFEFSKENEKQAFLPAGSTVIENHYGTAPGFYITFDECLFFFLPGVPAEMKPMFKKMVVPVINRKFNLSLNIGVRRATVFGLGESKVGAVLKDFDSLFPELKLSFRIKFPLIELKIVSMSSTEIESQNKDLKNALDWVTSKLGDYVVSDQGRDLAQEVGYLLKRLKKTLAIAESCTGGLISNLITDVAGSSDYFLFTAVTYTNDAKVNILGVDQQTIIDHGAVHEQTAIEMAAGARRAAGADFAISTTGVAGPGGGTDDKPVGMVCIGIAGPEKKAAKTHIFYFKNRDQNKKLFAATALNTLRQALIQIDGQTA
jgi:nicotinamide-nucleotide amidase